MLIFLEQKKTWKPLPPTAAQTSRWRGAIPTGPYLGGFRGRESILGGFGPKDLPALPVFFLGGEGLIMLDDMCVFCVDFLFLF